MQIIKHSKWFLLASVLILVPGIISLFVYRLNLDIDFTGGSNFEYSIFQPDANVIREVFESKGVEVKDIVIESEQKVYVKAKPVDSALGTQIKSELLTKYPSMEQLLFETVGPSVGLETTKKAFIALGVASVGILLYIAFAFRNIPAPYSSFKFGVSAIIAMLHDALMVLGVFSILGHFFNVEIDALFITAILTIIGFSVHDTIVVFDRIRENLKKLPSQWAFSEVVNYSIIETLNRSLATSLTVLITLSALLLLGGDSIRFFTLALLIGIVSGTYSSIFTASPILVYWETWSKKRKKK